MCDGGLGGGDEWGAGWKVGNVVFDSFDFLDQRIG